MSTNDDSASRRGRRADQGEPDWRAPNRPRPSERWDQPSSGNRDGGASQGGRDAQPQNTAYSGFTRPSYSQSRQEPAAPAPPARPYDPHYQDSPPTRQDGQRPYLEPTLPSYTPPPPYNPDTQPSAYGDSGRDDLFGREPAPGGYGQNPYGSQGGYAPETYDQPPSRTPLVQPAAPREPDYYRQGSSSPEDYERGFGARISQEPGSSRFFLPEEQSQAPQQWAQNGYASPGPQAPADRGYASQPPFPAPQYDTPSGQFEGYGRDQYDARLGNQQGWRDDRGFHDQEPGLPVPQALHGDELDEDFFGDEEDFEEDHGTRRKGGRIKLVAAALAAAVVAAGGAYYYKSMGGDKITPFIRADDRPAKDVPGNPGGRQFANGEKAIYERLTPDGQTQVASFAPLPASAAQSFGSPAAAAPSGGNSLEDRIEEALRRAQRTGDAPPAAQGRGDQPTVVRSESYRPDGTRVESRPVITPSFGNASQLPPPFGNAVQAQTAPSAAPVLAAPFRAAPIPAAPSQPQFATAMATPAKTARAAPPLQPIEPVSAPAGSFYVSLKSAPDEKAIQKDLPSLSDKYKSVLGDVQVTSKIADLGSKGVTYRAVAGPLGSRQEAMELCQKIKGVGGDKACFVTN